MGRCCEPTSVRSGEAWEKERRRGGEEGEEEEEERQRAREKVSSESLLGRGGPGRLLAAARADHQTRWLIELTNAGDRQYISSAGAGVNTNGLRTGLMGAVGSGAIIANGQ
jgi:hypothetical protein